MTAARTELARILALRRGGFDDVALSVGVSLRRVQHEALGEWRRALRSTTEYGPPGLALLAGCGAGKTLTGLLLPSVAAGVLGRLPSTLYLVPSAILPQWRSDALAWNARGAHVPREITIRSHEALSAPSGRHLLRELAPDVIVIDEAHAFGDPDSGRWRRVSEYLRRHPDTRVVVMSGSITSRSVRQCRHLLLAALRGWCPLPADSSIDYWASVLDVGTDPHPTDLRALDDLVSWAGFEGPVTTSKARAAYRRRLEACPGVVLSTNEIADVSLLLGVHRGPVEPPAVRDARQDLVTRWALPDGTELVSALEYARAAASLPLGFYLRWRPGTAHPEWVETRRVWLREVRALVAYAGAAYQTPAAVEVAAKDGRLDPRRNRIYQEWATARDTHRPPETEAVWLDGGRVHLLEVVRSYLREHGPRALVWCRSPEVGTTLAALLYCEYHGQGSAPPPGDRELAIASYLVHGTGWDGASRAGYTRALVLEPPTSGATWEQLLGRLHRPGARGDVDVRVYAPSPSVLDRATADARYVTETTGAPQRLLTSDWAGYRPAGRVG